ALARRHPCFTVAENICGPLVITETPRPDIIRQNVSQLHASLRRGKSPPTQDCYRDFAPDNSAGCILVFTVATNVCGPTADHQNEAAHSTRSGTSFRFAARQRRASHE